jgi:hypothetical protein
MSNPNSANQQHSNSAQNNQPAAVYSDAQQEKLVSLQGEIELLLAQIQAETKLASVR